MKTPLLVGVVVAVHCVAVGSAVFIQGCRTMQTPKSAVETPMPAEGTESKPSANVPKALPPVSEKAKTEQIVAVETTTYVVGDGDSMSVIAYKYGLKVPEIMALNCMTNPNKLKVGQKLILPGKINIDVPKKRHVAKKAKVAEEAPEKEAGTAGAETATEYTVVKGDLISRIAVKHGTTTAAIKKANALTSDKLKVGQKLMVPGIAPKVEKDAPEVVAGAEEKTDADTVSQPEQTGTTAPAPAAVPEAPKSTPTPVGRTGVTAPVSVPVKSGSATTYTVEPNDDITKIARSWGVKAEDIKKANNITDDSQLKPGKVLTIPMAE